MKKIIIFILFLCMFFVFGFRIRTSAMTISEFEEAFSNLSYLGIDDNEEMNDFLNNECYSGFLSDEPCITFVTYGINGSLNDWGFSDSEPDKNSIGDFFVRRGCNLFFCEKINDKTKIENKNGIIYTDDEPSSSPQTIDISKPSIVFLHTMYNVNGLALYSYDDLSEIIDDKSSKPNYFSIEQLVNLFIYEYMQTILNSEMDLFIPRINMIGHSAGGIINMEYAIEHPNIVDSLFSIGTPYNGSKIADALNDMGHPISSLHFGDLSFNCDAIKDCIDADFYLGLKYFWNQYQNSDSLYHTKLYAIGASISYQYFIDLAYDCSTILPWLGKDNYDNFIERMENLSHDKEYFDYLGEGERYESDAVKIKKYFAGRYYNFETKELVSINGWYTSFSKIRTLKFAILGLYNSMIYDKVINDYVIKDDIFVDIDSQQAKGYLNVEKFEKIFTDYNNDLTLRIDEDLPAIGHNMETKDEDILNCILSNIILGLNDNGMNIKKESDKCYTYIGFSYKKAVSDGILEFKELSDDASCYKISSKMFDNNYTICQKYLKNEYVNSDIIADKNINDGIIEILFSQSVEIEDNTFNGLKGQVLFTKLNPSINISIDDTNCTIIDGSLYKIISNYPIEYKLLKFGRNSLYIPNLEYDLPSCVNSIESYAFFCQPITRIVSDSTNNIVIGDYAFYGCTNIDFTNFLGNITTIGDFVISNNILNNYRLNDNDENDSFIINNALIRYSGFDLKIDSDTPIDYIGPNAFCNNEKCEYVLLDKNNLYIANNSFTNPYLKTIFIYKVPNFDDNFCVGTSLSVCTNISNIVLPQDIPITNKIRIDFKLIDESIDSMEFNLPLDYNIPIISNINFRTYDTENYNCFGFKRVEGNVLNSEVYQNIDLLKDYGNTLELYYECNNTHNFVIENIDESFGHYKYCINCSYMEIEEHLFMYELHSDNSHDAICSCGYSEHQEHIFSQTASACDESHHRVICTLCGQTLITNHNIIEEDQLVSLGILNHIRYCENCEYYDILYNKTVIDMGSYHLIDGEIEREHEYTTVDYQDVDIMVCLYCGHHEHNGLIGSSNDDYTHNLYCYFCQEIVDMPHCFENYESIWSNLENGYHTKECSICGTIITENHSYIENPIYSDNHHFKCSYCGDEVVFYHNESTLDTPNDLYHPTYCEICEYYYNEVHHFAYCDIIESDEDGHYVICNDCGYIKYNDHNYVLLGTALGHFYKCIDCGYETGIENHILLEHCIGDDPHNHYLYCSLCNYQYSAPLEYERIAEYDHYVICALCETRMREHHHEHCYVYNEYLHIYTCLVCDVHYEMPHFVNDHVIIYENFEPGYDLYVCTYCGYTEIRRR